MEDGDIQAGMAALAGKAPNELADILLEADKEWAVADRLVAAAHAAGDRGETHRQRSICRAAAIRSEAAKRLLAVSFGESRGWRLSHSRFDLETLSKGKTHSGSRPYYQLVWGDHAAFDHPFYYRNEARRAVAIAAHLYGWPNVREECEAVARRYSLTIETPDYPSWWFPGQTVFVLYGRSVPD